MNSYRVLVTGAAGFIGFHVSKRLCELGYTVTGVDNLNPYYDVKLKNDRLTILRSHTNFIFQKTDVQNKEAVDTVFKSASPLYVIHLAAQAGVRYSLKNPYAYLESNVTGFLNILESCKQHGIKHLIYASSSSVYGANRKMPFSTHDNVDHPLSLYAATKKSNELMAHVYSNLFHIPSTGLRFFTVYGPFGRPDMAMFIFTKAILEGKPIDVYNNGKMKRDFTYIDDIVEGIIRLIPHIPQRNAGWNGIAPDPASSFAPYRIYNIGNNQPVELLHFIEILESKIGKKAIKHFLPMQDGDVSETFADIEDLIKDIKFKPSTPIDDGIENFVNWYLEYYKVKKSGHG